MLVLSGLTGGAAAVAGFCNLKMLSGPGNHYHFFTLPGLERRLSWRTASHLLLLVGTRGLLG
jgi:hypothetical protein